MIISNNDIHVWCVFCDAITDPQLLSRYHSLLNENEKSQHRRFYFEKHRHQYLVTRALVRSVLSLYEKRVTPEQWQFKKNNYGKPYISNIDLVTHLRYNLSHTDELIVMAVILNQEIGIDVEYLPRLGMMSDIANKFFSPHEAKQLQGLREEQKINRFCDLWTLKEAYIKACGMGLSIPLNHFSYSFSPDGKISIDFIPEREDLPELWQFWQICPSDRHKISMALKSNEIIKAYSIGLYETTPLVKINEANYPMAHGSIIHPQCETTTWALKKCPFP